MKASTIATALSIGVLAVTPALAQTSAAPQSNEQTSNAQRPGALSTGMVQHVQTRLQQQGLYHGNIDGVWGPETRTAVRDFQRAHGLNPSGLIDAQTLADLKLGGPGQAQYSGNQSASGQNPAATNSNAGYQQSYNGPNVNTPRHNAVPQLPPSTANPSNTGPNQASDQGNNGSGTSH